MSAISSARRLLGCALVGLPLFFACTRSSDGPAVRNERAPLVVPYAPKATDGDEQATELPEREPRPGESGHDDRDDSNEDVQVEIRREDGGAFSLSAKTVRDGGFSFRFSGSVSVSTDGSSVNVTISPDAGSP